MRRNIPFQKSKSTRLEREMPPPVGFHMRVPYWNLCRSLHSGGPSRRPPEPVKGSMNLSGRHRCGGRGGRREPRRPGRGAGGSQAAHPHGGKVASPPTYKGLEMSDPKTIRS